MNSLFVVACSGPGAGEAIGISSLIGLACAVVSIALTVWLCVRVARAVKTKGLIIATVVAIGLVALHPLWTLGVISGDCGYTVRMEAPVVLAMHVGLLLISMRAPKKPDPQLSA